MSRPFSSVPFSASIARSRGAIVELDDGETARTARTIPRDSQGLDLPERREERLKVAGGSVRRQVTDVEGGQLPSSVNRRQAVL